MPNLKIDFYESGIGDTIVVTFPGGGVGIVDAHPSAYKARPDILDIVANKHLHFVCLSHPHTDHGADLVRILKTHADIDEFWHTVGDIAFFLNAVRMATNFPSPLRDWATEMNRDLANFSVDLYDSVTSRGLSPYQLRSDLQSIEIDGVDVHCLAPDVPTLSAFTNSYRQKLTDATTESPDPNSISAVLALKFGDSLVLLGADARKENWGSANKLHHKRGLPKAQVLKVPHHGARNSFAFNNPESCYLNICASKAVLHSVIFAGDSKHPNDQVYAKLRDRSTVYCLTNGRKTHPDNPLKLKIAGARLATTSPLCNPIVSFELDLTGNVKVLAGHTCVACEK